MIERPTQTFNIGIYIEIVLNLRGSLYNINGQTQEAELECLRFHSRWDKDIFYKQFFVKVEWLYCTMKYLFK